MANSVTGTCMLMCPESEIEMRQREGLVHVLETRPGGSADRRRMVKMFSRSAAGKDMTRRDTLRPPPVLKRTVNYLLSVVVCEKGVPWSAVYSFVTDRLRAVRQDLVIQQASPPVCCTVLEPVVRFHAYAAYRMCEEPLEVFDPHLNQTHLNESLKQLLVHYDCAARDTLTAARDQMEALYGLLHLGHEDVLCRLLSLQPPPESCAGTALKMSLAQFRGDYVTVCRWLRRLPPLLACVTAQHLPLIRRRTLSVMNTAYSSKNLRYPVSRLSSLLLYSCDEEAVEECRHYGISVSDDGVHFLKGSFDSSVKQSPPKKLPLIDEDLENIPLPELLLSAGQPED